MKAYCLIREGPHYRHDAFVDGLRAVGYAVTNARPDARRHDNDVLVLWNRYGDFDRLATQFAGLGGRVIVAENAYCAPKDAQGNPTMYAISLDGHNGSGVWFPGDGSRFAALGLTPQPWQDNPDGHILICGQRGIGSPRMASPPGWHDAMARKLATLTKRRIVVRHHPEGPNPPKTSLAEHMAGAWAVVIWSSASGIAALLAGIPVYYDAPRWICEHAASRPWPFGAGTISTEKRLAALQSMAWAQWSLDEIRAGAPFRHLLQSEAVTV